MKTTCMALACSALLFAAPVVAQQHRGGTAVRQAPYRGNGPSGFIAVGPGMMPVFPGADQYGGVPFLFGKFKWHGLNLEMAGSGLRMKLLDDASAFNIGPVVGYRRERDSSDAHGRLRGLDDVKGAGEAGAFVEYRVGGDRSGQGRVTLGLSWLHDINSTYDGSVVAARMSWAAVRSQAFSMTLNLRTTWASRNHQRTYFGISPKESLRTGLPVYEPGDGMRDVGLGLTVSHQFNRRWGLIAHGGVSRYMGRSADSPIVDEGSRFGVVAGVAVSRRF